MNATDAIEPIFRALADHTRRRVVERLCLGPASVSELAAPFEIRLPSFVQHLSVLEECRLVRSRKQGRVRIYEINPEQMKLAENWLAQQRKIWEQRLDQLDEYLKKLKQQEEGSDS